MLVSSYSVGIFLVERLTYGDKWRVIIVPFWVKIRCSVPEQQIRSVFLFILISGTVCLSIRMFLYHKMEEEYFGTVVGQQCMMPRTWAMQGTVD